MFLEGHMTISNFKNIVKYGKMTTPCP